MNLMFKEIPFFVCCFCGHVDNEGDNSYMGQFSFVNSVFGDALFSIGRE